MLTEHNKSIQGLDARLLDLKAKINDSEATTGQEISKVYKDLSSELEKQTEDIQKVR